MGTSCLLIIQFLNTTDAQYLRSHLRPLEISNRGSEMWQTLLFPLKNTHIKLTGRVIECRAQQATLILAFSGYSFQKLFGTVCV